MAFELSHSEGGVLARIAIAPSDMGLSVRKGPGTLAFHAARVPRRPGLLRVHYDAHVAGAYLIAVTYHGGRGLPTIILFGHLHLVPRPPVSTFKPGAYKP